MKPRKAAVVFIFVTVTLDMLAIGLIAPEHMEGVKKGWDDTLASIRAAAASNVRPS